MFDFYCKDSEFESLLTSAASEKTANNIFPDSSIQHCRAKIFERNATAPS